jgi:hypothetical protein
MKIGLNHKLMLTIEKQRTKEMIALIIAQKNNATALK